MLTTQENKYAAIDGRIVNRATGKPIPDDEPVMIFRAKDRLAAHGALLPYAQACAAQGLDRQAEGAVERYMTFMTFAEHNPDRMNTPTANDASSVVERPLLQPKGVTVVVPGAAYTLSGGVVVQFVGEKSAGTTTQEVLEMLLDRVKVQNSKMECPENASILLHLTAALGCQRDRMARVERMVADLNTAADGIKADLAASGVEEQFGIAMLPCKSSNVEAYGYRIFDQTMAIRFRGGAVYHYAGVPQTKATELEAAESKGSYISREIAGKYQGTRMNVPTAAVTA